MCWNNIKQAVVGLISECTLFLWIYFKSQNSIWSLFFFIWDIVRSFKWKKLFVWRFTFFSDVNFLRSLRSRSHIQVQNHRFRFRWIGRNICPIYSYESSNRYLYTAVYVNTLIGIYWINIPAHNRNHQRQLYCCIYKRCLCIFLQSPLSLFIISITQLSQK